MFKTKIKYLKNEKANRANLLQSQDSVVIEICRGKKHLKFDSVCNYFNSTKENSNYIIDLLFSYKNELLYTVSDENYWCPTCERLIRKHYSSSSNRAIKDIMNTYREAMAHENSSLEELINANYPILSLLPSGKYVLSLRNIFPTFGEDKLFSEFTDKILTASTDSYYRYLDNEQGSISVEASTSYMLPTQLDDVYSEETLNVYRTKDYLGRGLVVHLSGFVGCLLDGHHKATVAYERNRALECLVVERYTENAVYRGIQNEKNEVSMAKIPTIHELCYLQNFIDTYDITTIEELKKLTEEIIKDDDYFEDMEQLIIALGVFKSDRLIDLYPLIIETYLYKDIRLSYFDYLSQLERTATIESAMLDFLINDDYENKQLTKLCEDYFRE